ncbi:tRNA pseudouridine synthase B [Candidatus Methylacidithermus pantelleriae]|uniref:tRNA pseudouridine synthase B n=2 Tax=Candidatus Methylacidithermus pantelleriae TaxID=2744239 RepID=A0A8J2BQP8_9BACT|nr:tRNA pseudouridine synthase B [Candidatus Methylacidithermus pantelleriae]
MPRDKLASEKSMEIDGVLLINKPKGYTSHDMVAFIRRKFHVKKVGHCGTLDPIATGLLILVLGKATKIQDLLMSEDKVYRGRMRLGQITDTQDADGVILEERPVPQYSDAEIQEAFERFTGDFYQTPPMISAVKYKGIPLYKLARAGKNVERKPRIVHLYYYKILGRDSQHIDFEIGCSKGFYVRTYCHDIGLALGCGAHLVELTRLRSGNFTLDQAISWETLQALDSPSQLLQHVLPLPEVSRLRRR